MAERELHFGLMFWANGTHPSGWRMPTALETAPFDIEFLQSVTQIAEAAKFDFLFLGDRLASDPALQTTNPSQMSRLEPFISAASLAAATNRIGIVVTANPTYYDPFAIAHLTASLDHLSGGRASWNLVTGADEIAAANFSRDEHWDTDKRYDWAEEFVQVAKKLWDSWDEDGYGAGPNGGAQSINHRGRFFSIDGPLPVRRPPQGHVVILHAGTSDRSRELAARDADVVFAAGPTIAVAKAYYDDVKTRAKKYGRTGDQIAILPGMTPIVAPTTAEAVKIYDQLNSFIKLDTEDTLEEHRRYGALGGRGKRNLSNVTRVIEVDVRGRDPDEAVDPRVLKEANEEGQRLFAQISERTRRDVTGANRITYRDLIIAAAGQGGGVVGNPVEVADYIQDWFEKEACDGFNIFPSYNPDSVSAFADLVVPVLQDRGLYRRDYSGPTFRDHLGLARPANTLTGARAAAAE
ncbi:xenobiotic compound monooxygenase A subunit [Phenylobacterium sp. Root77]|jgi:FMN-dependent oxidoreductase (nitrilotriacetate monooxygenase family)|uniref:NtaA/DmoA family FMN-dependent monooxygenase n=1 Tax=unclassified Phenylobacterium TaxID=2640670 RepID=UPI0006FE6B8D|nr:MULTISPECIES: NtaA/DmoA family FMN-dependent monooxygenase [unclassified Phenylobacterium]KQW72807.1 xenobiotic compound monooxygenase A subunit [Phenylobacterium sp. Root1277]KQW92024.1 xenobiotic compound monooxygenase A subunit [Phenylobacterium sp. Root1290]KRC40256.1 xenobiotic compound monooxygenase A subunit [Phenylobacterium sp. Root77]